ncbi:DUF4762 family protein [Enterobacillus tribolii]|uniref:Uncharacterized protein n=1 Tax=Enterobacillus tribolii TaxID=1487935 RepID=A0A370R471_9GAMM|nr:DUF4762 family protein [Enterobacillus tribolii]MBW7983163.1 hypothetical protein [Enterobacillus tribolii]RDK97218.1 hypothetical protein C8D90_101663 [Enterobacillus tribolii]
MKFTTLMDIENVVGGGNTCYTRYYFGSPAVAGGKTNCVKDDSCYDKHGRQVSSSWKPVDYSYCK